MLYANGHAADASARLLKGIREEKRGAHAERIWLMLLELHQVLGEKREFEARALEFALRFLRSAPAWRDDASAQGSSASPQGGSGAFISLTGKLSADSAPQLERIREVAEKNRVLRIDFSKLQGADGAGCKVLLGLLQAIRRRGGEAMFTGESVLLRALAHATKPGEKEVAQPLWLLRLEILQWQGRQQEFDDVALDYAITYEISPPSFEAPAPATGAAQGVVRDAPKDVLRAPREFGESSVEFLQRIENAAASRQLVVVDCSDTDRVDFLAAGKLLDLAVRLKRQGTSLEVRNPNPLVAALLDVVGVTANASIVRPR